MAVEPLGQRRTGAMEGVLRGTGALGHQLRNARAGRPKVFIQRPTMQGDGFVHAVAGFGQARRQAIAALGNIVGDALARLVQTGNDIIAAHAKIDNQRLAGRVEALVDRADMLDQGTRHFLAGQGQLRRHCAARLGQARHHIRAMRRNLIDELVAGAPQGQADFLALDAQRCRHPRACLGNAVGDFGRSPGQIFRQRFLGRADGVAHPVGIADNCLALAGQKIDQRTDAALVVAIAALQIADLGMHQRFKLAGPRQRALDAIAHRCHLAADRLAERHHLFGRQRLGLGQAHRHLGHGARRQAHFLGAAQQRGYDKSQHNGRGRRQHDQRRFRADFENRSAGKRVDIEAASRKPGQRGPQGEGVGRIAWAHIHGLEHLPGRAAVVIGGGRGSCHNFCRRCGGRLCSGSLCGGRHRSRAGSGGLAVGNHKPLIDFGQLGRARLWFGGARRSSGDRQSGRVRHGTMGPGCLARRHGR